MSTARVVSRKTFIALLGFTFVLAAAPSVSSAEANKMSQQRGSSDSGTTAQAQSDSAIMAHAEMVGHTAEALHASRDKGDLKGAAMHAQMALKAGEKVQGAFARTKLTPEQVKDFSDGVQSLKEAIKLAQSKDSKGFEKATATAMSKISPEKKCDDQGTGGCTPAACGCALATPTTACDPLHPTKKCTTVGCSCFCM